MLDVLQDEQDLEDDANAVLGAADDKNCTYSQGELHKNHILWQSTGDMSNVHSYFCDILRSTTIIKD